MGEFGHISRRLSGGGFIDTWGAGPFVLEVAGKRQRFEDSDRFGPLKLRADDMPSDRQWSEGHPFWEAHRLWSAQGRRLAADGITCVWSTVRPTIIRTIAKGHAFVVAQGEDGGLAVELETPEGQRALKEWVYPELPSSRP